MSAPQIDDAPADLGSITPPATIPQTGPAEPYPRVEHLASVTALPSSEDTGPINPVGAEDEDPDALEAEETPAHPARPDAGDPAVAGELEQSDAAAAESAAQLDPMPSPPPKPKESAWEYATSVGYWMSVSVGAAGQIFALADLMNIGWMSYPVAAAGAAFAEVTMIGASKRARNHRIAEHAKPWRLLLVIACVICGYATAMNFVHWLRYSVGMAIMFAGGSAVGFSVETTVEHIEAAAYERRKKHYENEYRKWRERQARSNPARSRPAATAPRKTASAAKSQPAKTAQTSKSTSSGPGSRVLDEIVAYAQQHSLGARAARNEYRAKYRPRVVPSEPTVKRALNKAKSAS